jgi:16S rRNA (guanine(966)-N(2))-methyltransferase RsmD
MGRQRRKVSPARTASKTRGVPSPVAGVRIIGGEFRGRKLQYSGDVRTRPMKDRSREALFSRLGKAVQGKLAVDLFAGTGALGLEAVSRGAAGAVFIEQHGPTARAIGQSAATLDIEDRVQVIIADTFHCNKQGAERFLAARKELDPQGTSAWLVFCSPPYDFYVDRVDEMLKLLGDLIASAPAESLFVVEADARFDVGRLPEPDQWDFRPYPPAFVGIYRKGLGIGD